MTFPGAARLGSRPINSTPGGLIKTRCDPYGAESRIKLLGGVYGPEHLGRHMWFCEREAEAIYRMVCDCLHHGQPMPLCGPGIVIGKDGQPYPHPGHAAEISKRQAGLCPACCWPPKAREFHEAGKHAETALTDAYLRQDEAAIVRAQQAMTDAGKALDELWRRGIVHRCPLRLIEVS
jgi:hypothetical protein